MAGSDLQARVSALLETGAPESSSVEYKFDCYPATEGGRKEFAKDLSGFANRDGGLLILGVKERNGVPQEVPGIVPAQMDSAILWLESVARSAITPHLPGVAIAGVEHNGAQLIAVSVPRGLDQPYEVAAAGARFFVRDERSVRPMSREELKFAVRREADLFQRISEFVEGRWRDFVGNAPDPQQRLQPGQSGGLLIVTPIFDETFSFRFDLPTVLDKIPHYSDLSRRDIATGRARIDAIMYTFADVGPEYARSFAKIYRHGAVELADGYVLGNRAGTAIPGGLLMPGLISSITAAIQTSRSITGASAFAVDFRIRTAPGTQIAFFAGTWDRGAANREELVFDRVVLEYDGDLKNNGPHLYKPLLDQLWQAFGHISCGYFDDKGVFTLPR